jgi:hypothetical protein
MVVKGFLLSLLGVFPSTCIVVGNWFPLLTTTTFFNPKAAFYGIFFASTL